MAKKTAAKTQPPAESPPPSVDQVIQRALNVKRPPEGWPWERKARKGKG